MSDELTVNVAGGGAPFATVTVELTWAFVPFVAVATTLSTWLPFESVFVSSLLPSPLKT